MADWIKVEKITPRKPEVLRIAAELRIHPDHAFGLCFRFWSWCDDNMENGNASGVTDVMLDALLERDGIATALRNVGWLSVVSGDDAAIQVPNFERHLSSNAKKRGLSQQRTAKSRAQTRNARSVTDALPEKIREDKNILVEETQEGASAPVRATTQKRKREPWRKPTVEEVAAYCCEIGATVDPQAFHDYYESNGWKINRNPMKDWKATVRNWQARQGERASNGNNKPPQHLTSAERRENLNAGSFDRLRRAAAAAAASGNQGLGLSPGAGKTLFIEEHGPTD